MSSETPESTPAIILAGGLGTRLRTVVSNVPKVLAPVAGRPFLHHLLRRLDAAGFVRVVLAVGYLRDLVMESVGSQYLDLSISYSTEEEPLGTGGAIRQALAAVEAARALVINGDTWLDVDYRAMLAAHMAAQSRVTLAVVPVNDVSRYGSVVIGADGRVVRFAEKGERRQGLINGGVYVLEQDVLCDASLPSVFSFESDFLVSRCEAVRPLAFSTSGQFIDIGVPEDYEMAKAILGATG
ncbi:MAG: nucleotidyltransferase family protein [bacterium]|jgi:D-glycero-alpha-D-manno-heptose 1-phosphate guanylyltransferase